MITMRSKLNKNYKCNVRGRIHNRINTQTNWMRVSGYSSMYRPDCQSILFFWLTKQQENGPIVTAVDLHETRENRYPGSVERQQK